MSRCVLKITESEAKTEIVLSGSMDETFSVGPLKIDTKNIEINTKDLRLITSNGVRAWIKFIERLSTAKITFIECSKVFIDQVNSTHGFCPPNAKIHSFYAPYFNRKLNTENSVLFTRDKDFKNNEITAPKEIVGNDGVVYTLDVNETKYFKFIKSN